MDGEGTTNKTVSEYIQALVDAYLFYPVQRFNIKGKDLLRTRPKYYPIDIGIRNYLLGYRNVDRGRAFESMVFHHQTIFPLDGLPMGFYRNKFAEKL